MITLVGYSNIEEIYKGERSSIYRGIRDVDIKHIIIKVLSNKYPSKEQLAHFQYEYEIESLLHGDGTVKVYALEQYGHSLGIVYEDYEAITLRQFILKHKIDIKEFLVMAIQITEMLEKIHQHHIIHKDLKPENILWNEQLKQVKIIDFGNATLLEREDPEIKNPWSITGTLAYTSPEATGRMNRSVDYRTDFYSLGVIFYEILTKTLPFSSLDAMELVYSHIAKLPQAPHKIDINIPETISDIVMKLLEKQVEERYQSCAGIKKDLMNCLEQLTSTGNIIPFILGKNDISDQFQIQEKLYGREHEIQLLIDTFKRASESRSELIVLAGSAGIGKTRLVNELNKVIIEKKGYFISGKFDQFQKNIPYSAIIQAFQNLIEQIASDDEKQINIFKKHLLNALGSNGQVIIDVIPLLENIIGKQPPASELGQTEIKNRFNNTFQNFIGALATESNPLMIFLDDLQWIDSDSLNLLKILLTYPTSQYFLIVGSYRDNAVNAAHPLMLMLDELKKYEVPLNIIHVEALKIEHVEQLLADTIHHDLNLVKSLAKISYKKTQGNAFFLKQFLQKLYRDKLIEFDHEKGCWNWDIEKIKIQPITNNVADLIAEIINQLPKETQQVLMYASCLGTQFDLNKLAFVIQLPTNRVAKYLWNSISKGVLIPIGESYKFVSETSEINPSYEFLHDRIQQAAYSLIPKNNKKKLHLEIGQSLLKYYHEKLQDNIFEIVDHVNIGIDLITDENEKIELAKLNLLAGQKANLSAAFKIAYTYFQTGINIIGENYWDKHYELSLHLHTKAISAAYSQGDFNEMEKLCNLTLKRAKSVLDKIEVYETKIYKYIIYDSITTGTQVSLDILHELGENFPSRPTTLHVIWSLFATKWAVRAKSTNDLLNLPRMTDSYKLATIRILSELANISYFQSPLLSTLCVLKAVRLSVKYGNAPDSAMCYAQLGTILCITNKIDQGYAFGQLALNLIEKYQDRRLEGGIRSVLNFVINHWKQPVRSLLDSALKGYLSSMETGNLEYVSTSLASYTYLMFYSGVALNKIEEQFVRFQDLTKNVMHINVLRQTIKHFTSFDDQSFDNYFDIEKIKLSGDKAILLLFYSFKMILYYFFYDYTKAYQNSLIKENYYKYMVSGVGIPVIYFYDSLVCLAKYTDSTHKEKRQILKKVIYSQKKMEKWADQCPQNYLHRYYLVKAELARVTNNIDIAADYYDLAIDYSQQNRYIQDEALANELAGKFYLGRNKLKFANVYFISAHYLYKKWGAEVKIKQLEESYPEFFKMIPNTLNAEYISSIERTPALSQDTPLELKLDLNSVVKFSQTLAKEVILTKLLKKLMHIIIQTAGAQNAFLILKKDDQWVIEAEASSNKDEVEVLQHSSIENIPNTIINYVIRTNKSILLSNAVNSNRFKLDPCIIERQSKSILCLPLINKGQLSGLLYLENNLIGNAFTKDRSNLLNMFTSQIAISIDNATLYTRLTALISAYEHFVPKTLLRLLDKKSITEIKLGDYVQSNMTIMFCDIRNFTSLSEKLLPNDIFIFINQFLNLMEPIILQHNGFIDKYIGDAVMAVFTSENEALSCSIMMFQALSNYNKEKENKIHIGIGLNSGISLLGIVGGLTRVEGTVISDAVNVTSRVQELTKLYGAPLLITEETYTKLDQHTQYCIRQIDTVQVKGRSNPVTLYEVFEVDEENVIQLKKQTYEDFEYAISCYNNQNITESLPIFQHITQINPKDTVAAIYIERCRSSLFKLV